MIKQEKLVRFDLVSIYAEPNHRDFQIENTAFDGRVFDYHQDVHFKFARLADNGEQVGYISKGKVCPLNNWRHTILPDGRINYYASIGVSYSTILPIHNPEAVLANQIQFIGSVNYAEWHSRNKPNSEEFKSVFE